MQRIALGALACALLIAGCTAPQPARAPGVPPGPLLSTRTPTVVQPVPAPVVPAPTPVPPAGLSVNGTDISVRGGIKRGLWKVIVVHHAATDIATPLGMHRYHLQRGWENGLGYDFVIGNGVNYPDGKLYVGPRWRAQEVGAHCKSGAGKYFGVFRAANYFNEHGIGICLIGDFEKRAPTPAQLRTLRDLICVLVRQTGISPSAVYGHGEVTHKTACPGRRLNMDGLRRDVRLTLSRMSPSAASSDDRRVARN